MQRLNSATAAAPVKKGSLPGARNASANRGSAMKSASTKPAPVTSRHESSVQKESAPPRKVQTVQQLLLDITTSQLLWCRLPCLPLYPSAASCLLDIQEIPFPLTRLCRVATQWRAPASSTLITVTPRCSILYSDGQMKTCAFQMIQLWKVCFPFWTLTIMSRSVFC